MAMGAHPEASLRRRTGEAFEQKHAIARGAASVILPGENILLAAGSVARAPDHERRGRTRPRSVRFDRVFLGADAVTAEDGICEADHAQTRLKELMARRGNLVYVLADSSKLGLRPIHACARLAPWTACN
jgi:DeoR/GlpR family transcriptional regulator of sugar metabolism